MKTLGWLFAVVFIAIGVLGFVPALTPGGNLLGIFQVSPIHNVIHLLSGIAVALAVLSGSTKYVKMYFQVFGVVYALVTVLGFVLGGNLVLLMVNMADNFLHLAIAVASLYIGFGMKE